MKNFYYLIVILCISVFASSAAIAQQDYQLINTQGGVDVTVRYNPSGINNLIVAYIRFINRNPYKVDVVWTPFMNCPGQNPREGYGAPFSIDKDGTYEVTIWRSQACGAAALKGLQIKMDVKEAGR